ncbi:FecR family protein [Chitinophaga solisilvae]|uniref:FecR family protein n=1 Tax=Chitinophaga solisilvae TaxID=1233460 RepID=UPI00136D8197|nr:FecR family protein [Chitinophaga solisilvae]
MNAKKLAALLQKYQDGQCTEEERYLVENFYQGFDADEDRLPDTTAMQEHYQALYENMAARIQAAPAARRSFLYRYRWAAAAAALLLAAFAGSQWLLPARQQPVVTIAAKENVRKRFIKLSDGSSVLLNAGSRLQYPAVFEGNSREVYLTGEAYFDIAGDTRQPFIVHTGKVTTTVLGTVFNIKALPQEEQVTVTVARGKVKVDADGRQIGIIGSNEQISVDRKKTAAAKTEQVSFLPVAEWTQEDIVFNNITYAEAAAVLKEKYSIQIVFENSTVQQCRFTTSFMRQSSLEDILSVLCAFNQSSFTIKDSIVTIRGGGCQ